MKIQLSSEEMANFPIHDSEFMALRIENGSHGERRTIIDIVLCNDEVWNGLANREFKLVFEDCWYIISNLCGYQLSREQVDDWNLVAPSGLIDRLRDGGLAKGTSLNHYKITFSGGSQLDIIATKISVEC